LILEIPVSLTRCWSYDRQHFDVGENTNIGVKCTFYLCALCVEIIVDWIPAFAGMTKRAGMTRKTGMTKEGRNDKRRQE
jgi:hypothetical protein